MSKFIDMTGWIMKEHGVPNSRWTVIKRAEDYVSHEGKRNVCWVCRCECGKTKNVSGTGLRSGDSLSCGCAHYEQVSEMMQKQNKFNLDGEYGIGYTEKGEEFWFDLEDYNKIKNNCWHYDKHGDLVCRDRETGKYYKFQRVIMDAPNGITVDHIVHDKRPLPQYDNRKSNLRFATKSQQVMNTSLRKDNTSGRKGVYKVKSKNKWRASITENGKTHELGTFNTFEEAVKAREDAENLYFGDYKYQYNII